MKAIVSVIGKDKVGIISEVAVTLSKLNINIEDISQTVMQDYFTMIMMVELDRQDKDISKISSALDEKGKEIGVTIRIQHVDIFNAMHKI